MAWRMWTDRVTLRSVPVVDTWTHEWETVIALKGSVPGSYNALTVMSYTIRIVDAAGKKKKDRNLSEELFADGLVNNSLIHEYVVMYLANQRQSTAHTKTRGEIQTSGRKLYRQKWTGRARVWDAWSPIRRKWWVVFGPRNTTDWSKSMPQKMKRKALCGALTLKAKDDAVVAVDKLTFDTPKTAEAAKVLKAVDLEAKKTLIVATADDTGLVKSFGNIPTVTTVSADTLNAYDVLSHKNVLFTVNALDRLETMFTS